MNEQKILAKNNQQNKKVLIYETTDKQKKESVLLRQRECDVWPILTAH